jgi:DNA-binding GntR family transcriptional regulator
MSENREDDFSLIRLTTKEFVVGRLRDLILNRHFKPGQKLVQDELARQLGVSRTPVREALHQLATEGLVTFLAYRGASVAQLSVSDLVEIYTVRIALEGYAAYLAAEQVAEERLVALERLLDEMRQAPANNERESLLRLNRKFHTTIYAAANRQRLLEVIIQYIDIAEIYRRIFASLEHCRDELVKHQDVVQAMRRHDAQLAEVLTRRHLEATMRALTHFFESSADGTDQLQKVSEAQDRGWLPMEQ